MRERRLDLENSVYFRKNPGYVPAKPPTAQNKIIKQVTWSKALPSLVISLSNLISDTEGDVISTFLRISSILTFLCTQNLRAKIKTC